MTYDAGFRHDDATVVMLLCKEEQGWSMLVYGCYRNFGTRNMKRKDRWSLTNSSVFFVDGFCVVAYD